KEPCFPKVSWFMDDKSLTIALSLSLTKRKVFLFKNKGDGYIKLTSCMRMVDMMEELQEDKSQLEDLEEKIEDIQVKKNELLAEQKKILHERDQAEEKVIQYEGQLNRLKRKTPSYLFALVTGRLRKEIKQKEASLTEATRVYEAKRDEYYALGKEISVLTEEKDRLPSLEDLREELLLKQAKLVENINSPLSKAYLNNEVKINKLKSFLEDMQDLKTLAETAKEEFAEVKSMLVKATRWGALDFFTSKGYADHKKHTLVSEANSLAILAQGKRKALQNKLTEIEHKNDVSLHMHEAYVILDFVFDGLYSNLLVQGKIEEGIRDIELQQIEVDKMINTLTFRSNGQAKEL